MKMGVVCQPSSIPTPMIFNITNKSSSLLFSSYKFRFSSLTNNNHTSLLNTSPKKRSTFRCYSALNPELKTTLDKVVTSNKVILFMKGTKDFPQCGFSNTVVQILKSLDVPFETLDILENEILRQALKEYSAWPTFPQLYIDGEFFGGCDITVESLGKNGTRIPFVPQWGGRLCWNLDVMPL
ncbi:hypothetical protein IFM89_007386 [Coptis chinensis]|uniref:Glutaredoxin domain-containing protein n=1 Tax=Coptis chinensis TaxID=261450 RepID=A0A835ILT7_9MAGN|nr:hypothetical protein IFM89_007386 [Coptis chinensis]